MIGGQVAMSMNYFAFFPALVNPGTTLTTPTDGFAPTPRVLTVVRAHARSGRA